MTGQKEFKQYIKWNNLATKQNRQDDWMRLLGLNIGFYLNRCVMNYKTPTFGGFFEFLKNKGTTPKEVVKEKGETES